MAALLSLHTKSIPQPKLCFPKMTKKPRAVLNRARKMQVPYEQKQGQTRIFHQLPSGLNIKVIVQNGVVDKDPYDYMRRLLQVTEAKGTSNSDSS